MKLFYIACLVVALCVTAHGNVQMGNQFDSGVLLGSAGDVQCTLELAGTVRFNSSTNALELCKTTGVWSRVGQDEETLLMLSQILVNQQRLLSGSGNGSVGGGDAQSEQNRIFCSGHGVFQRTWSLEDPSSCSCYDDDLNGHHTGERCRDCVTGWAYSEETGSCTQDVDECTESLHDCHPDATCSNTPGGWTCQCNPGYSGDGLSCSACSPGHYETGNVCEVCPEDTFQPAVASTDCITCPLNSTTRVVTGATSLSQCFCTEGTYDSNTDPEVTVCEDVGLGYYSLEESNGRQLCPPYFFSNVTYAHEGCTPCPSRSHTNGQSGSDEMADCVCGAGYYDSDASPSVVVCTAAPTDSYSPEDSSELFQCPTDSSNAGEAASTESVALLSGAQYGGTYDIYTTTNTGYIPEVFGTFTGLTFEYVSGYISCNDGSCPFGSSPVKWQTCNRCSNDHGNAFSVALYTLEENGDITDVVPQPSFLYLHPECTYPDRVSNPTGSISCTTAFSLSPGQELIPTWIEAYSQVSINDNGGTITININAVRSTIHGSESGCACNAGYYDPQTGAPGTRECVPVGKGYYSGADSNDRTICPTDAYSDSEIADACTPCPEYTVSPAQGATHADNCSVVLAGLSPSVPADSCLHILTVHSQHGGSTPSGNSYYIQPPGTGSVQQVYCDMETRGGGWTLVGNWENQGGYTMYSSSGGIRTSEVHTRNIGIAPGGGVTHYSSAFISSLFHNGESKYMTLCGSVNGGSVLAEFVKNTPDAGYDAYRGVYDTLYAQQNGFTMSVSQSGANSNPLPSSSLSFSVVGMSSRTCGSPPPAGVECYHYLPDDVTDGGQWLFRENQDNVPRTSYSGSSNVPSLLFVKSLLGNVVYEMLLKEQFVKQTIIGKERLVAAMAGFNGSFSGVVFLLAFAVFTLTQCSSTESDVLDVYIVAHSHCDAGWLYTYEQYYEMNVSRILNTVVDQLSQNPEFRFVWAETIWLSMWWNDARTTSTQRDLLSKLVKTKQIELVGGCWVMNDETLPRYSDVIDQCTHGHWWISETFGPDAVPTVGWQIDMFSGYSGLTPTLWAMNGYESMVLRYEAPLWERGEYLQDKLYEFIWRASKNVPTNDSEIFVHMIQKNYGELMGAGFDFESTDYIRNPPITPVTIEARALLLCELMRNFSQVFKGPLMVPWGVDFKFDDAGVQFGNMSLLITYINDQSSRFGVRFRFSTVKEYLDVLYAERESLGGFPVKEGGDYEVGWPHAIGQYNDSVQYQTGCFRSRPAYKHLIRSTEDLFRLTEFTLSLGSLYAPTTVKPMVCNAWDTLSDARGSLSLVMHHDSITGTMATTKTSIVWAERGQPSPPHMDHPTLEDYTAHLLNASGTTTDLIGRVLSLTAGTPVPSSRSGRTDTYMHPWPRSDVQVDVDIASDTEGDIGARMYADRSYHRHIPRSQISAYKSDRGYTYVSTEDMEPRPFDASEIETLASPLRKSILAHDKSYVFTVQSAVNWNSTDVVTAVLPYKRVGNIEVFDLNGVNMTQFSQLRRPIPFIEKSQNFSELHLLVVLQPLEWKSFVVTFDVGEAQSDSDSMVWISLRGEYAVRSKCGRKTDVFVHKMSLPSDADGNFDTSIHEGPNGGLSLHNANFRVNISGCNGKIESIESLNANLSFSVFHDMKEYINGTGGAYILVESENARSYGQPSEVYLIDGPVLTEVWQHWSSDLITYVRLYHFSDRFPGQRFADTLMENVVEMHYAVGELEERRELISEWEIPSLDSKGEFITDESGLESKHQVYNESESISANYRPLVSSVCIRGPNDDNLQPRSSQSAKHHIRVNGIHPPADYGNDDLLQFTIVSRDPHGTTSRFSGQIETMLHRRTLDNDGQGPWPLNDTVPVTVTDWIIPPLPREVAEGLRPRLVLAAQNRAYVTAVEVKAVTAISGMKDFRPMNAVGPLSEKVFWLTMQMRNRTANCFSNSTSLSELEFLSRFLHIYETGHGHRSDSVKMDLSSQLLDGDVGSVSSVTEKTLTGVWNKADHSRRSWDTSTSTVEEVHQPESTIVELSPVYTRTFAIGMTSGSP